MSRGCPLNVQSGPMATPDDRESTLMGSDEEDILASSLELLYGYTPIVHSYPGQDFKYSEHDIILRTPDTIAANWSLHANSIWVASLYLAAHLDELELDRLPEASRILELGAGAGLPGILVAKKFPHLSIVISDFPDEDLIETLSFNIRRNNVSHRCRSVPFAWGTDPSALSTDQFDLVMAADTLWNPESHDLFVQTLSDVLRPGGRAFLVAGLHTGRFTLASFLKSCSLSGFQVEQVSERRVRGDERRVWAIERIGEDEQERRCWVLWIVLRKALG